MKSWVAYQKNCHHIQLHKCEKFKKLLSTKTKCTFQTQRPRMPTNCSNWRWIHHQYIPVRVNNWRSQTNFVFKSTKKIGTKEGSFKAALTENIFRFFWWNLLKQKKIKNIDLLFDFQKKIQETVELFLQFQIVAAQNDAFSTITWKNDSPDSVHQIGYNLLHQYF